MIMQYLFHLPYVIPIYYKAPKATITEPEEEEGEEITESQHPNQNKNIESEDSVEIEKNKVESRKDQQFILPDEKFREMAFRNLSTFIQ